VSLRFSPAAQGDASLELEGENERLKELIGGLTIADDSKKSVGGEEKMTAIELMLDNGFGSPSTGFEELVGIVTLGDLQQIPAERWGTPYAEWLSSPI
jgi:hypothetical protein